MIYGIGIDLVACSEFTEVLSQNEASSGNESSFLQITFTEQELQRCRQWQTRNRCAQCLSARYAAKEAFLKALDGERFSSQANFDFLYKECEVRNDEGGRPFLFFHGSLHHYVQERGIVASHLTMSHIAEYAMASVILENA